MIIESGMGIKEATYTVKIANYNLPSVEWRYKILQNKVSDLEFRKQSLEQENDKLRSDLQYDSSVLEGERRELQKLCQQTNCVGREGTKDRIIQALSEEYLLPQPSLSEEERADLCISIIVEETDKLHRAMIRRKAQETLDSYFCNDGSPTFPRAMNSQ
jgi:hypothetical protein